MSNITCPHCGGELTPEELKRLWAAYNGSKTTESKAASARANGAKGGRPVGSKNKPAGISPVYPQNE